MTEAERFYSKAIIGPRSWCGTACMERDTYRNRQGYGAFSVGGRLGRTVSAHRWAYEHEIGPIAIGLEIDHLCRNPSCVNVRHLEPVTGQINRARGNLKNYLEARRTRTHCIRGHEYTEENTRVTSTGRVCRVCTRENAKKYKDGQS